MRVTRRRRSIRSSRPVALANPPARRRRKVKASGGARRTKHHSPAMRAKISRAVKAAIRRGKSGGATRRRSISRRPARRVARRSSGMAVARRSNRIVMGRLLNSPRRRFRRRNNGPLAGIGGITKLLSKETLLMAGGAVTASIGTGFILNRFGASLPLANNKYGQIAYQVAIPLLGAYLLRKKSRDFSNGLVIGGVVMAITSIMKSGIIPGTSQIVQGPMGNFYEVNGMGLAGELGRSKTRSMGAYIGPKNYHTIPDAVNAPVFGNGAW